MINGATSRPAKTKPELVITGHQYLFIFSFVPTELLSIRLLLLRLNLPRLAVMQALRSIGMLVVLAVVQAHAYRFRIVNWIFGFFSLFQALISGVWFNQSIMALHMPGGVLQTYGFFVMSHRARTARSPMFAGSGLVFFSGSARSSCAAVRSQ
jgi:hypothetical protein